MESLEKELKSIKLELMFIRDSLEKTKVKQDRDMHLIRSEIESKIIGLKGSLSLPLRLHL